MVGGHHHYTHHYTHHHHHHLNFSGWEEVEGCICRSEDRDWVGARQSLRQPGRPERGHQGGEGRVDGESVEHRAGQAARPCENNENMTT